MGVSPTVNGFGGNSNGNPFSGNVQPNNPQMTFTAASNAERNRLKQMQAKNTTANGFGNTASDPFGATNTNDPFSSQNTGADDPFFAANGGGPAPSNNKQQAVNQNANDDPFAVWGL